MLGYMCETRKRLRDAYRRGPVRAKGIPPGRPQASYRPGPRRSFAADAQAFERMFRAILRMFSMGRNWNSTDHICGFVQSSLFLYLIIFIFVRLCLAGNAMAADGLKFYILV